MTFSNKTEYIQYRLDTSYTTFEAARVLADNEFWNSAVNRLYYSVFYAVSALLVVHDIHTKTHSAVKGQFSLHFVKTGVFDKKYGQLLSELFDWRQKGDYENIFEYDQESVEPLFIPVKEMLDLIKAEIQKSIKIQS
jgi:uncharacterized protein (UPF0332 family)